MSPENANRPKIGIPWRTSQEEATANRPKIKNYEDSVRRAGGEPVLLSLNAQDALAGQLGNLDNEGANRPCSVANSERDCDFDCYTDSNDHCHRHANSDRDCNGNCDRNVHAYCYCDCNLHGYCDSDGYRHRDRDSDGYRYGNSDC